MTTQTPRWEQVDLAGDQTAVDDVQRVGTEILRPYIAAFHTVSEVVQRAQQRRSYTVTATGTLRAAAIRACSALRRHRRQRRQPKQCTNYVVREVTHTLSRSEYRQDFTLMTNAVAKPSGGACRGPGGGAFM